MARGRARRSGLHATLHTAKESTYRRAGGPWDVPTLESLLSGAPQRQERIVDGDRRWSSVLLQDTAARLAAGLQQAGVRRHDVVAWQLPNSIETVLLYRACWRIGAVAAPLHPRAGDREVELMLDELEPVLTIRNATEVDELIADERFVVIEAEPSDVAVVLFTAGSTGRPKGVLHTHRSLAYKAKLMVEVHGLSASDAVLMPAPLAHVSGLLNGLLVPSVATMKSVLMSRWDPDDALALIATERISFMVGPPTFFVSLLDAPSFEPSAVASLRLLSVGGAGVSEAFVQDATSRLEAVVKRSYGSTEMPTVATATATEAGDVAELSRYDGHVIGEAEVLVAEPGSESPLPDGEEGELLVRGPELFAGYLDPADNDAAIAPGGWFRTGDLARRSEAGWLTITGRLKQQIIRGGENISVAEVEAALEAHPAVRRAAVTGYADERLGERVAAFVVTSAPFDVDTCRTWFAERGIAKFKTPEQIVVVDDLPVLETGKVDRSALAERLTPR